jgi:hypothetical protein
LRLTDYIRALLTGRSDRNTPPAYCETDEAEADQATIIENILTGLYWHPLRVIAFNPAEGWSRDVTEDIAIAVRNRADSEHRSIGKAAQEFLERAVGVNAPLSD